jgi:hypothetical protein
MKAFHCKPRSPREARKPSNVDEQQEEQEGVRFDPALPPKQPLWTNGTG